jgi:hypothetical protein
VSITEVIAIRLLDQQRRDQRTIPDPSRPKEILEPRLLGVEVMDHAGGLVEPIVP